VTEHLTRHEILKSDVFQLSAGNAFDYYNTHRRQVLQIAGAVLVAAIAAVGIYFWMQHSSEVRTEKLSEAMQIAEAPVGPSTQPNVVSYPTQDAKDAAEQKAFSQIAGEYNGTRQGAVAEYTLAGMAASAGKNDEARTRFNQVIESGSREYASLAQLALAELDYAEGKPADGEKLLRELIAHPTAVVSKDQATLSLVHHLAKTSPAEANQLLKPLLTEPGRVGQAATSARAEITSK
jgi:hypothetical protein